MNNISASAWPLTAADFRIRDPFIVPEQKSGLYYLFGTTDVHPWDGAGEGFLRYTSPDLTHWSRPAWAFRPEAGFWADRNFWAPEVHRYRSKWYMPASFKAAGRCRGVQILCADALDAPFRPITDGPVTPADWECLDGTLYLDEDGRPWLVFSHEWTQIGNGAVCCAPLTEDLSALATAPTVLFHAKDAPWSVADTGDAVKSTGEHYVTDGPFLFRSRTGTLCMLWSSFGAEGYAIGVAESATGRVTGPWRQNAQPLFAHDGGHGMLFSNFAGQRFLAIHAPNRTPEEHLLLMPVVL